MEYKKNDRVTLTIEDMGSDGEGIGKVDGFTLFIKDAVIGDQVEAEMCIPQTVRRLPVAGTFLL